MWPPRHQGRTWFSRVYLYADDTQVSGSCRPFNVNVFSSMIPDCLGDAASVKSNRLQINSSKTEVMSYVTSQRTAAPSTCVGNVSRRRYGRPSDVSSRPWRRPKHENSRTADRVVVFRRPPSVATDSPAYTASHVPDTGDGLRSVPIGLWQRRRPTCLPCTPTPSALHASSPMTFQLRRSDHINDALASWHWLRVPERIQLKIAVLMYKVLHGTVSRYLGSIYRISFVCALPARKTTHASESLVTRAYNVARYNIIWF